MFTEYIDLYKYLLGEIYDHVWPLGHTYWKNPWEVALISLCVYGLFFLYASFILEFLLPKIKRAWKSKILNKN